MKRIRGIKVVSSGPTTADVVVYGICQDGEAVIVDEMRVSAELRSMIEANVDKQMG